MDKQFIFRSARLGFRNWTTDDLPEMTSINTDARVMEFFPSLQTWEHTTGFIERMQKQYAEKGYCYFAVERLDTSEFIGFIGLSMQTFEAPFTPCVDVGWRLAYNQWNQGFATEGAKCCLQYAFDILTLEKVAAICPAVNTRSEAVMKKIGMQLKGNFIHPLLDDERLKNCLLYEIGKQKS